MLFQNVRPIKILNNFLQVPTEEMIHKIIELFIHKFKV